MNGQTREPEPNDDDIPTLTEIIVPGRLPAGAVDDAAPSPDAHTTPESELESDSEFVFDIDFERAQASGENPYEHRAPPPSAEAQPHLAPAPESGSTPRTDEDGDLPLPWSAQHPPEFTQAPPPASSPAAPEPLIVAAQAKAQAVAVAQTQALLRSRMDDAAANIEQRLHDELAQIELRLRVALREELDRTLTDLLAGVSPTS